MALLAASVCQGVRQIYDDPTFQVMYMINDSNSLYLEQARPYMEGIRLISQADVVIASPQCFEGLWLEPKSYDKDALIELLSYSCAEMEIYETYMETEQLMNLMNYKLSKSLCSSQDNVNTILYSAYLDFNLSDCIVRRLYTCTWYESTSMNCRRWTRMVNQRIKVAFTEDLAADLQLLFPKLLLTNAELTYRDAVGRFVPHYDGHMFSNFQDNWKTQQLQQSRLCYPVITFIAVSLFQTIKSFYQDAEQMEEESLDVLQDEDDDERRYAKMTRREIVELLSGSGIAETPA